MTATTACFQKRACQPEGSRRRRRCPASRTSAQSMAPSAPRDHVQAREHAAGYTARYTSRTSALDAGQQGVRLLLTVRECSDWLACAENDTRKKRNDQAHCLSQRLPRSSSKSRGTVCRAVSNLGRARVDTISKTCPAKPYTRTPARATRRRRACMLHAQEHLAALGTASLHRARLSSVCSSPTLN